MRASGWRSSDLRSSPRRDGRSCSKAAASCHVPRGSALKETCRHRRSSGNLNLTLGRLRPKGVVSDEPLLAAALDEAHSPRGWAATSQLLLTRSAHRAIGPMRRPCRVEASWRPQSSPAHVQRPPDSTRSAEITAFIVGDPAEIAGRSPVVNRGSPVRVRSPAYPRFPSRRVARLAREC